MRVAYGVTVCARGLLGGGNDGIGHYTRALLAALRDADGLQLQPFTFGRLDSAISPEDGHTLRLMPYPLGIAWSWATRAPFPGLARRLASVDLIHATDHLVPASARIPVVATIMDAVPLSHPEWVQSRLQGFKAQTWRDATRRARHVITISEFSRAEIVRHFDVAPERVTSIPLAVDARFHERFSAGQLDQVLGELGLPRRYFLCVGTLQPRKNVHRILAAHRALPAAVRREYPLVVVGRAGWSCDELVADLQRDEPVGFVRWLRYLPDEQLRQLMQGAVCMVMASLYEGFGLPVLEAFASRVPLIASGTTAVAEVAGEAALLVDPLQVDAISDAMLRMLDEQGLRDELVRRGSARVQEYSWDKTARETLQVYQRVLERAA